MTDQINMPDDWWAAFWNGWIDACSGRVDEEQAYELATGQYPENFDRPGDVVAAELYARSSIEPSSPHFIYPDDVPF